MGGHVKKNSSDPANRRRVKPLTAFQLFKREKESGMEHMSWRKFEEIVRHDWEMLSDGNKKEYERRSENLQKENSMENNVEKTDDNVPSTNKLNENFTQSEDQN